MLVIAFSRPEGIKKEEKRKPVFYIVIVVGMYLFFTYTQSEFNKQFNISGSVFGKTVSSGLLTIISYFSGALATVGIYLDQINNTPFLGHSFRTLINFLNPLGLNINTTAYQPTHWVYIPFRYNTSSIQYYIFSEGNWPWTIIFFFLFGYIFAKVYIWFKRKKSFSSMLALCFLSWMAVLSSREYIMVRLDSFFFIVFILITYMHEAGKLKRIVFRTRR